MESELDIKKQFEEMFKRIEAGGMFHCYKCQEEYPIRFKVGDICKKCAEPEKSMEPKKKTMDEEIDEVLDFQSRASGEG